MGVWRAWTDTQFRRKRAGKGKLQKEAQTSKIRSVSLQSIFFRRNLDCDSLEKFYGVVFIGDF